LQVITNFFIAEFIVNFIEQFIANFIAQVIAKFIAQVIEEAVRMLFVEVMIEKFSYGGFDFNYFIIM
jgi:hypothetical protein